MRSETVRTPCPRRAGAEEGMALVTVIMVMMLVSVLMVGFVAAIIADNRSTGLDRDQTQAYAATHAGLEKLTSDLSGLFLTDFSPNETQVTALLANRPTIAGFQYLEPNGSTGYKIEPTFGYNVNHYPNPDPDGAQITKGPYQGLIGLITPYDITVTARSSGGAEVRMRRTLQTIAVPAFQFGMFSETDLSFFAGSAFNFGGRVHTNGNLFLAAGGGVTLTLSDRITAVGEIVRTNLSNGWFTNSGTSYTGTVNVPTTIMANPVNNINRALARTEGSLVGTIGSLGTTGPPSWKTLSETTYKGNIRTWMTGAKRLDLPLVSQGAVPVDLIRRPLQNSNEDTTASLVFKQRYFSMAALRILLSDTAADITNLPTVVTGTPPVPLDGTATAAQLTVDATHPPLATSPGPLVASQTNGSTSSGNTTISLDTIPAFLKAPVIRVNGLPAAGVLCSFRTATQFSGCAAGFAAAANGSTVSATVPSGAGTITVTTTLTSALGSANAATLNVVSTAAFAPGHFWANTNPPQLVSCTGNDTATRFTGCTGITATINDNIPISTNALASAGQPLLNGFIKIEKQTSAGVWSDVTTEILNLGIAAKNQDGTICNDPTPDAVIRLQRLRDNGGGTCTYLHSLNSNDYWPNGLYDTREGIRRDKDLPDLTIALGGVIQYVTIDVGNLKKWFAGTIGTTGTQAKNDNGYIVYFSDRRNNKANTTAAQCVNGLTAPCESGEYGFEDVVNPDDVLGVPNGGVNQAAVPAADAGEDTGGLDANGKPVTNADGLGNGVLEVYGATPQNLPTGNAAPYTAAARPWLTTVGGVAINAAHAMVNRQILFRRALKLVNGGIGNMPPGFTVAAENPVYVQGNYNASANIVVTEAHVPAAILADAVTVLSTSWSDTQSFLTPNEANARNATTTGYRVAIVSGKNLAFARPTAFTPYQDFGTDGGAHNFLRYLEDWGGQTLNYRGSIVSFYFSRQATGVYKYASGDQNVYSPPTRGYNFDTDFLTPALLPPGTPMFRDINTLTFRQWLRPNQ